MKNRLLIIFAILLLGLNSLEVKAFSFNPIAEPTSIVKTAPFTDLPKFSPSLFDESSSYGPNFKNYFSTLTKPSATSTPNLIIDYKASTGKVISRHFFDGNGKIEFELNYRPHNMFAPHGHFMSTPGIIRTGHYPKNHVPFMLVPKKYW